MKKYFLTAVLAFGLIGGNAGAESGDAMKPMGPEPASLDGYDIEQVVGAVVKGMGEAARNYYLPDKPENARVIKRYTKDSRKAVLMNTSFKRELAQVCLDVAKDAANAGRDKDMLPGRPLILPSGLSPVPLGVSSKTVSMDGDQMSVFTNSMPCIDAAVGAMHDATLRQFPETASSPLAKETYTREFGKILTVNRLFNHLMGEVCAQLVGLAKKYSEQKPYRARGL